VIAEFSVLQIVFLFFYKKIICERHLSRSSGLAPYSQKSVIKNKKIRQGIPGPRSSLRLSWQGEVGIMRSVLDFPRKNMCCR